jgi:Flp pilus assembly protein protease CpaA
MRTVTRAVWSTSLTRMFLAVAVVAGVYGVFILQIHSRAARAFSTGLRPVRLQCSLPSEKSVVHEYLHR